MSGKTHRLQIGDITCIVLHEGPAAFSPAEPAAAEARNRFPNATEDEIQAALHTFGYTQPASMNALFIESAGTRVLVDTGMGSAGCPNLGHIPAALTSEGIGADDIDIVFITHFHGDHYKGLLKDDGTPRYPNSRLITTQVEWDYWMSDATLKSIAKDRAANLRKTIDPLTDSFSFLDAEAVLVPGVTLVDLPGHTPGHTGLLIESNGERLLAVVDLLHTLAQFTYPHWHFAFDTNGDLAEQSRKMALGNAADSQLLTLFYHLPFPGLGHITRTDDGAFAFQAI